MSTAIYKHPNFVSNQLLTSTQLNQLFDYLDAQQRLSRIKLTGAGIICGLHWDINVGKTRIKIDGGYGLSSEGFLLKIDDVEFSHYVPYWDPDVIDPEEQPPTPIYEPWQKTGSQVGQVEGIRQLLTEDEAANLELVDANGDLLEIKPINAQVFTDSILVLYLEKQIIELESCLVTDCDDKGQNYQYQIKALLVPDSVLAESPTCPPALQHIQVPRFHTQTTLNKVESEIDINGVYLNIVRDLAEPLADSLHASTGLCAKLLGFEDPSSWIRDLKNWMAMQNATADQVNQYIYDVVLIIVAAHNELIDSACPLIKQCCLQLYFPCHLMLGHTGGKEHFRHEFMPAAVANVMQGDLPKVRALYQRLTCLVEALPDLNDLANSPKLQCYPSSRQDKPLSERGIPWYFAAEQKVLNSWRADECCTNAAPWAYDHKNDPNIQLDTLYNQADIVRVDGHLSMQLDDALQEIQAYQHQRNLEFCVQPLFLTDEKQQAQQQLAQKIQQALTKEAALQGEYHILFSERFYDEQLDEKDLADLGTKRKEIFSNQVFLYDVFQKWGDMRCNEPMLCEMGYLASDYQILRAQLMQDLMGLRGYADSILKYYDEFDHEPEASVEEAAEAVTRLERKIIREKMQSAIAAPDISKLSFFVWLKTNIIALKQDIDILLTYLPTKICAWNFEIVLAKYKALLAHLLSMQALIVNARLLLLPKINLIKTPIRREVFQRTRVLDPYDNQFDMLLNNLRHTGVISAMAGLSRCYQAMREANTPWLKHYASHFNGLEPLFSVPKGGTLYLIYDNENRIVADFASENCHCCCIEPTELICLPPLAITDIESIELVLGKTEEEKRERELARAEEAKREAEISKEERETKIRKDAEVYMPVKRVINVMGNDFGLMSHSLSFTGDVPMNVCLEHLRIELISETTHLKGQLKLTEDHCIIYSHEAPLPHLVDRFQYRLIDEHNECKEQDIGEVIIHFLPPAVPDKTPEPQPQPKATVSYRVIDIRTEENIFDAEISVTTVEKSTINAKNDKGLITISDLTPGTISIVARAQGYFDSAFQNVIVAGVNDTVTITPQAMEGIKPAKLKVNVFDNNSQRELKNASVKVITAQGQTFEQQGSPSQFAQLPPGNTTVEATVPGFAPNSGNISLKSSQSHQIDINMQRAVAEAPRIDAWIAALEGRKNWGILLAENTGVSVEEAAKIVTTSLKSHKFKQASLLDSLIANGPAKTKKLVATTDDFVFNLSPDMSVSEAQISETYKSLNEELIKAIPRAQQATVSAVQNLMRMAAYGYMDRLVLKKGDVMTEADKKRLATIRSHLNKAKIDFAEVQKDWGELNNAIKTNSVTEVMEKMR